MIEFLLGILNKTVEKVKELRIAIGIVTIATALAIAGLILKDQLSNLAGVIVAINMGIVLLFAILMFIAATKAKGQSAKAYQRLYFILTCVFSLILLTSAVLSLSSVFFGKPLDFSEDTATTSLIEPIFDGEYRIEESVLLFDLRQRLDLLTDAQPESKTFRHRIDRVVRQKTTTNPYKMQSGTNGDRMEGFESRTHSSMSTKEVQSSIFGSTTDHTYIHSIESDRFPISEVVNVELKATFVNSFRAEPEEWLGVCPNTDTKEITFIILFPENKRCINARAMELPTGSNEIEFRGTSKPVIHDQGRIVTWTLSNPVKGVGYYVAYQW
ncbi:hypothetical protein [Ekhidna sp.]|uniref:hypothetical protein n=1 Tax=Ekhidna sp. TaxID=2608089 RepID=UPI00329A4696